MNALSILLRSACACAAMVLAPASGMADPVADFYRGKTISLYVGFPPGGGYDLYARVLAPYFTRHIPGNPQIVIKSMLGGSGIQAAGYMTKITPQDGTSLGVFLDTLTLGKVAGRSRRLRSGQARVDRPHRLDRDRLGGLAHLAGADRSRRPSTTQILMAGTVASNTSNFIPTALNDLIGTKIQGDHGLPRLARPGARHDARRGQRDRRHELGSDPDQPSGMARPRRRSGCSIRRARSASRSCRTIRACSTSPSTTARARSSRCSAAAPTSDARSWPSPAFPPERAAALAPGLHGDDGGSGIRGRDAEAQPQHRAAERRRGAAHRRGLGRDAEGTGRAGQALYRRASKRK